MTRGTQFWIFVGLAGAGAIALGMLAYLGIAAPVKAKLRIGADQLNSEPYEMASAIAEVVERNHPDIELELVETLGSGENMQAMAEGRIDLALVEADLITRENVSLLASLYPDLFQLVVHNESDIHAVGDLEGHRIAVPPVTSGQYRAFWFLANQYGVAPEKVTAIPMSDSQADKALLNGEVDALFRMAGARNSHIRFLIGRAPLRLVPIDQGAAMHLRQPAFTPSSIPKGAYRGDLPMPPVDLPTLAVDRLLVARNDLPNDVVRAVTSVLFENRRDLVLRTPLAAFITQPSFEAGTALPVHEGAEAYFNREQPSMLEEKAEFLALLLSLGVVLGTLGLAVNRRLAESKKARIEDYAAELLDLEKEAKQATAIPDLNAYKQRLTQILAQVVEDMRQRRVSPDGLQLFAFVWESVNYTVNDHEEQLRLGPGPTGPTGAPSRKRPGRAPAAVPAPS